ncbi:nitroreductase family protein [Butyrivibrio sp. LC3010]|uniref:nitroreductase family protein n=1 Tax=Butyrivibrio sp. LC3010 TaxID=1280680 RepID=UPI000423A604|nr:nitroreductase family protein [Butyrivibrio sp. LC3010]
MGNFLDEVKSRRSVRTFDGNGLDEQTFNDMKKFADEVTNPFGVKIRFAFLDAKENNLSSPVLSGEKCYVSAMVKKEPHADEAYGYSFEKLLIEAHRMGLGTVWIGGTMPREKFEAASKLEEGEFMPCMSPLGKTAAKMSVKESLMRKGVKADSRYDFDKLFFVNDFNTGLTEEYAKEHGLYEALEAVRLAPSAVNKQPWRVVIEGNKAHFFEKHDKGFVNENYDLQRIDVGIALYHFESQLISEGKKAELTTEALSIAVPDDTDYIATYCFG